MKTEGGCIPAWESKIRGQMNSDQLDITKKKKTNTQNDNLFGSSNKWQIICTGKQKGTFRIFFLAGLQKNKNKKKKGFKLSHSSRAVPPLVLRVQETLSCRDVCGRRRAFHLIMSTLQSATA